MRRSKTMGLHTHVGNIGVRCTRGCRDASGWDTPACETGRKLDSAIRRGTLHARRALCIVSRRPTLGWQKARYRACTSASSDSQPISLESCPEGDLKPLSGASRKGSLFPSGNQPWRLTAGTERAQTGRRRSVWAQNGLRIRLYPDTPAVFNLLSPSSRFKGKLV